MKNLLLLTLAFSLVACGSEETKTVEATLDLPVEAVASVAAVEVTDADHNVLCGCKIESVGKCGNYVEFDGEYAELTNGSDFGLGGMEWCTTSDNHAVLSGTRTGGEFVATKIEVAE